jgi:hypothetical protein
VAFLPQRRHPCAGRSAAVPDQTSPRRDDRGVAFPSPVVLLSLLAVVMASVAFLATRDTGASEREITPVAQPEPAASSSATPRAVPTTPAPLEKKKQKKEKKEPAVQRGQTSVVVFNNSGITGLAGRVAAKASAVGWQVAGSDNWYGTIPTSTVYYPPAMKKAADQLALDLGIARVQPAVAPMSFNRLTVILTGDVG